MEGESGLDPLYVAVYEVVDDPSLDLIVSWSESNKSFIIRNVIEFQLRILETSARLQCRNLIEFFGRLSKLGFLRIKKPGMHFEFGHTAYFVRGKPELLRKLQKWALKRNKRRDLVIAERVRRIKEHLDVEDRLLHLQI